jgi:hypothetical protein
VLGIENADYARGGHAGTATICVPKAAAARLRGRLTGPTVLVPLRLAC